MKITLPLIQSHLNLLEEGPQRISHQISGFNEIQFTWSADKKNWSAVQVLAHIRACSDIWTFSIYAMLAEDSPTLPDLNERQWAKISGYEGLSFRNSFQTYLLQRNELLGVLRGLPLGGWSRSAIIAGRVHSVFSQVRRLGKHETEHCEQLEDIFKQLLSSD